jgi:hypothetical protein
MFTSCQMSLHFAFTRYRALYVLLHHLIVHREPAYPFSINHAFDNDTSVSEKRAVLHNSFFCSPPQPLHYSGADRNIRSACAAHLRADVFGLRTSARSLYMGFPHERSVAVRSPARHRTKPYEAVYQHSHWFDQAEFAGTPAQISC